VTSKRAGGEGRTRTATPHVLITLLKIRAGYFYSRSISYIHTLIEGCSTFKSNNDVPVLPELNAVI